jgi:EAL domain-containing protein (putative c-di-GMP-specific phosphodiesterase class I)
MSIGEDRAAACGACLETEDLFPFTMAFQPVVDIQTSQIIAHEALVRGVNGEGADYILSQVTSKNRYAFDQACRVCAIELASSLGLDVTLNINFLPNAVYQPEACIQSTLRVAKRTGFPLDRITFEIVEQEDLADPNHLRRIIAAYNDFGFKVALDDFGSGYSGLSRLAELKPDIVKIDRALITNCPNEVWRLQIITSMVELCQRLGVKIVAEGVENASEAETLRRAGVRFMQGFYFAPPAFESLVSASDIVWPGV